MTKLDHQRQWIKEKVPVPLELINPNLPESNRSFLSKVQITGWNFLSRRMGEKCTEGSTDIFAHPSLMYRNAYTLGIVITCLGIIVCLVFSFLSPQSTIHNNSIVEDRDTHGLYVMNDDALYPVPNMVSARLAIGHNSNPLVTTHQEITRYPIKERIGIIDAPIVNDSAINTHLSWIMCSSATHNYVYYSAPPSEFQETERMIVHTRYTWWLISHGTRMHILHWNPKVARSLGLAFTTPIPRVTAEFVNLFPQIPFQASTDALISNPHNFSYPCTVWKQYNASSIPESVLYFSPTIPFNTYITTHPHDSAGTYIDAYPGMLSLNSGDNGALYWLSTSGVKYLISREAVECLGLTHTPVMSVAPIMALFPEGTSLTRENAQRMLGA